MRYLKLFEEHVNEELDVFSLVGKKVFANLFSDDEVTVTEDMIDSIGEYLGDEGIPCTIENFKMCMANLEVDEETAEKIKRGEAFDPSFTDSEEDMLSDMRGEDDDDDHEDDED